MVKKKGQSKRVTLKQKYKIQRRVREHERKKRKEARTNPSARKTLKKDPGVPNMWPYKEQLLKQAEAHKVRAEEKRKADKQARREEFTKRRGLAGGLTHLMEDATSKAASFASKEATKSSERAMREGGVREDQAATQTRRAFFRQLKKVVESSDVVLEVLDARDPEGCRARSVEAAILAKDPTKKIVLVLNKIDLVPRDAVLKWLVHLRREFPTVAFKASTQSQRSHLGRSADLAMDAAPEVLTGSSCVGADALMQLLKNYSRRDDMKTAITVGVVGYPNVGKSSVINSLKRSKAAGVSSMPGFTRSLQEVMVDHKVKLIDCPGIIFDDGAADSRTVVLRNCVSVQSMEDAEGAVEAIVQRASPEFLMQLYTIPHFSNVDEFLFFIAQKKGLLGKGGVPDKRRAAKSVLTDWNTGKVPFFSLPPESVAADAAGVSIVSEWGKELDLAALEASDAQVAVVVPDKSASEFIAMRSSAPAAGGSAGFMDASDSEDEAGAAMDSDAEEDSDAEGLEDEDDDEDEDGDEDDDEEAEEEDGAEAAAPARAAAAGPYSFVHDYYGDE